MLVHVGVLLAQTTPSAPEARDELARELRDPTYLPSWWSIAQGWLADRMTTTPGRADLTGLFVVLGVPALLAAVTVGVVLLRRRRHPAQASTDPMFDRTPTLSAADHRDRAADHERAGRHDDAVIDLYRAIGVGAVERGLVVDSPDLTASEVGEALAATHPGIADRARTAGRLFDGVRYGHEHADADDVAFVAAVESELRAGLASPAPTRVAPVTPR